KADNILLALTRDKSTVGLAWLSLATGALRLAEVSPHNLQNELRRIAPAEVLAVDSVHVDGYFTTRLPHWQFDVESGKRKLLKQLGAASLAGYGCEDLTLAIGACGALLDYAGKTQGQALAHISAVTAERAAARAHRPAREPRAAPRAAQRARALDGAGAPRSAQRRPRAAARLRRAARQSADGRSRRAHRRRRRDRRGLLRRARRAARAANERRRVPRGARGTRARAHRHC